MKNDIISVVSPEYRDFITGLKQRVVSARISAARSMNRDLLLLYWDIGQGIVDRQQTYGWGKAVIDQLAGDLKRAFPSMSGFSPSNLWRMRQLYMTYTTPQFLAQVVRELKRGTGPFRQLATGFDGVFSNKKQTPEKEKPAQVAREITGSVPWGHHTILLAKVNEPAELLYYLRSAIQMGWSRNVLLNRIKADAYKRSMTDTKSHNFNIALPDAIAAQADEMLKSSYNLEFL
ncbi:MAG: hypothetical protein JW863_01945 [Chitinispirillaceae bacterium]|nr:hypothetical protein [Chitinispirillaceae bacterium]